MQWEEISEEEVRALKLSSRSNGRDSQYKDLLEAVKSGKTIKVTVEEGVKPKAMAGRLYTAAKAVEVSLIIKTTADGLALVVSKNGDPKPAPAAEAPAPEGPAAPPEGEPPDPDKSKKK